MQAHGKNSEDVLAAFLVGAGYRAFFGLGGWSQSSPTFEDHWMPQFDFALGEFRSRRQPFHATFIPCVPYPIAGPCHGTPEQASFAVVCMQAIRCRTASTLPRTGPGAARSGPAQGRST